MSIYANAEIDIFSVLFLLILFINMYHRNGEYLPDQKLFFMMMAVNAILLVLDSIQWIFDGMPGTVSHNINLISSGMYYMVQSLPCVLWCLYVRYQISMDVKETLNAGKLLIVPLIINTVLSCLSWFYGLYFYIDENNFYHRGELFWASMLLCFCYIIYSFIYVLSKRKETEKNIWIFLLIFPLPPLLGSALQIAHFGLSLIWPGAALSLLILYINIQKNQLYTDHLTGLYNRRLLDNHLDGCLKKSKEFSSIGIIMLDIDDFKSINDVLGHLVGDQALVETARILKKSVGNQCFLSRYGGDEFVVIAYVKDISDIERIANEIKNNMNLHNERDNAPYVIHLSMGYEIFKCGASFNKYDVIKRIDKQMYEDKIRC